MGVKLQIVLGVVLAFSVCASPGNSNFRQIRQVSSDNAINSTTPQDVALEKTDRHRNLIEKSPKTDTEVKNVNTNTQKNFTSVKLNKPDQYVVPASPSEDDSSKTESLQQNVVERVQFGDNKENTIKKDTVEKKREDHSRAIDVDIAKYVSPEFHSKNNVYTMPISSDTEKYIEKIFDHRSSTQKLTDFSHFELTTPKTDFFDNKFKEAVQSIDQKLEHIDVGENENDNENDENPKELQMEEMIEEYRTTPNSNLDYKELKNVVQNNTIDKKSAHKDMIVEQVKRVNYETSFNDTKVYNDDDDSEDKYVKSDTEKLDLTTPKNNYILTTRKSVTLTKPPSNRNNSHLLSNKIETDVLKAINVVTTELPTTKRTKGDDEGPSTSHNDIPEGNSNPSTEGSLTEEQTVHVKQVISTHEAIAESDVSTGRTVTTTIAEENLAPRTTTFNPVATETTIGQKVIETTTEDVTDNTEVTATVTPTQAAATETTTALEQQTEELTTTYNEELTTTESELVTTTDEEFTTAMKEDLKLSENTSETGTGEETTTYIAEIVTTVQTDDKVTEIETTERGFRTSKGFVFDYPTTTESTSKTDLFIETTENVQSSSKNVVITESIAEDITTTKSLVTTGVPTINKTVRVTIGNEVVNATSIIEHTSPVKAEGTSKSAEATVNQKSTTPLPGEAATDEYLNETIDNRGVSPTTIKPTPSSTIKFMHIDHVNNHTTFISETLNPSFSYPTPDVEQPKETTKSEKSSIINTTTEDGEEGTELPGTEEIVTDTPGSNKGTIAAIVISTVGAVCLVLLAGLLYIMRKRQKRFNYGQRCRPVNLDDYSMDNVSVYNSVRRKGILRASKRSYGNPAFDDPVAVTHPLNFPALAKFAGNTEDIKAEFEEIPQIAARTSELPEGCETKNRYANVIPLPETRVFLKAIDGYPNSDYINANYVTGPKNTKGYYIACQAPLQNTVDDFWRMVWEQQTKVILMITHLFENGVEKCVDYLPPSEVLDCHRLFGDFQITLKNREVKDKYIISSIQLKNMVSNSWREVTHFWYMGWPEKGVPSEANSLIAFLIEARSLMKSSTLDKDAAANGNVQNGTAHNEANPVVVHCSPGTGRTGVVIACDIAIREFEQTRLVDIPKIVYRIRRDRASAVQTKEQYMFIYKVVSLYATKLTGGALDSF